MRSATIDLTGLPLSTALAVAAADLDQAVMDDLRRCEAELVEQGARDEDLATIIAFRRDQLEAWREATLADLRVWLIEGERRFH